MRRIVLFFAAVVIAACCVVQVQAAWTEADWTAFDYQYDMSEPLGTADADSNGYGDFETGLEPVGGILTVTDTDFIPSRDAEALWPAAIAPTAFATGYTYEFRMKVVSQTGNPGAFGTFIGPADSEEATYMTIGSSGFYWGRDMTPLDDSVNTDDFHTFRVAQLAGESGMYVWRDGTLIGNNLEPGYLEGPADFWFGSGTGAGQGVTEIDHFAVTVGAVAPVGGTPAEPPEMPGHVDGGPVIDGGTTPYAWYRADEGVVTWEQDTLAAYWADQSGNDRHLTAVGDPQAATNGDGLPVVTLDGDGDRFESNKDAWGTAQPGTVFAVFRADDGTVYVYDPYHDEERQGLGMNTSDPQSMTAVGCVYNETPDVMWDNRLGVITPADAGVASFVDETLITSISHTTGATDTFNVNGQTAFTGDMLSNGMAGLRLGGYCISTRNYFVGDLCELIVFEGDLTPTERVAIEEALMTRWNVGGSGELEGDLNGDGFVGSADLDLVRGHWGESVSGPAQGDANGDGTVSSADLDIVRGNWGASNFAAVPEPGTVLLIVVGLFGVVLGRRSAR